MQRFRAYLQLVRFPAVFTALADILLGYLLNHNALDAPRTLGLLGTSSACLYFSGMVFNDVFDREVDAGQRPGRPIPSGRVSVVAAIGLGALLVIGGIAAAAAVSRQSLYVAFGLTAFIFAYDGFLKRTPCGPVAMGCCRFLNVMLGASASFFVWATPQMFIAAGLGTYIVGVTWFARNEATLSNRRQLGMAIGVVNLGLAMLIAFVLRALIPALNQALAPLAGSGLGEANPFVVLALLALIVVAINVRLASAWRDPVPGKVQAAVGLMLVSLIALDASLILFKTGHIGYAAATAALIIPAKLLGRWIFIT